MNVANRLTILRVAMIPVFVLFMLWKTPYSDYLAAAVFILACITDFFDGYLARKYNQVTTFGKFMDPLADKVLVCSAMICFVADPECAMPVWVVLVIIAREFIISGFRLVAAFDVSPSLVGTKLGGIPILHMDTLEGFLRDNPVNVGVLTVPARVAVESARRLCQGGVTGIWNFTNVELPAQEIPGVRVESVHFADSLLTLSYMISEESV